MKSQTDMITSIVAIVLAIAGAAICFFTKREPVVPPAPEAVVLDKVKEPSATIAFGNSLPGGGAGGGGGMRGMGGMGGPMSAMGGAMGMSGMSKGPSAMSAPMMGGGKKGPMGGG